MRIFRKHELLPKDATKEETEDAVKKAGYKVLKDICGFLGRDAKLFQDGKNIAFILSQPTELVALYYNLAVTVRHRTRDAAKNIVSTVFGIFTDLLPLINKYKSGTISFEDIKDLLTEAEADESEDRDVEAA